MPRGAALAHLFMLRRILQTGSRPDAILIDGDLLDCNPLDAALAQAWPAFATLPECVELAWYARDPKLFEALAAARFLPTYRRRSDIRAGAGGGGRPQVDPGRLPGRPAPQEPREEPRGVYLPHPGRPGSARPEAGAARRVPADGLGGGPDERPLPRRVPRPDGVGGIPVFWLLPPVHPDFQAARDRYGRDAAYLGYVRRLGEHYPHSSSSTAATPATRRRPWTTSCT